MKKYASYIIMFCLMTASCATHTNQTENMNTRQAVMKVIESRNYSIDVNYMNPMRGKSRALTTNYSVTVRNDSILSYLPYVGEAYNIPYSGGKALNFNAPINSYDTKEGKNGSKEIILTTSNEEDNYIYSLTVYPNGNAYIHIQPTNRQSISFNGEVIIPE